MINFLQINKRNPNQNPIRGFDHRRVFIKLSGLCVSKSQKTQIRRKLTFANPKESFGLAWGRVINI